MISNKTLDVLEYERKLAHMKNNKIIFMGTPEFAAFILKRLISEGYNIIAVVTQPDKKVGRKQIVKFSEVKEVAIENDIEVYQPIKIREDYENLLKLNADLIITAAYGQLIPTELLDNPTYRAINVHGSLLPKYRGGAPIHYAILNGDKYTGVTIMRMVKKMDAGNIISQQSFEIGLTDSLNEVYENMKHVGAELLIDTLPSIFTKTEIEIEQNEAEVTYAYNISREDEKIDFNDSAINVYNKIRAFNPFPVAYFTYGNINYKVYRAELIELNYEKPSTIVVSNNKDIIISCKNGAIRLIEFQPQNKKRLFVKDYLNGNNKFIQGDTIGN